MFEPLDGFERSAGEPRRYLMQKKRIGRKTTATKKSEINVSAKKSVSTSCALVEACGGKRWNLSIPATGRDPAIAGGRPGTRISPQSTGRIGHHTPPSSPLKRLRRL